ncbi:unnamed protein product [Closterium sp. Yama58-4]|nr:unnamed protein product [Closterium sp. Yama58-4]
MIRWICNAGPAGVPLTLATIRDHVALMARDMNLPDTFQCSVGWVRRALNRHDVRCMRAVGEAADQVLVAVRTCKEKLPQLLMHLAVSPKNTFNFDETALWISALPRKTYGTTRVAGRKVAKERLTVGLLVNADGSHVFRPLVISKSARLRDFRPDYDPNELCYWRNNAKGWMTSALNAAMYAEDRHIVIYLTMQAVTHVRLVFLPPNTTCFTQPLDKGLIAMMKARYRQHWLRAYTAAWNAAGSTAEMARFKPNLRNVVAWLSDAWMNVGARTIQRTWWCTGCLPLAWAMSMPHVDHAAANGSNGGNAGTDIDLDEEIGDVGVLIDRLALGPSAMPAAEFFAIDEHKPTCAEPGEDPLSHEPTIANAADTWEAPSTMQEVYEDDNLATREARRTARAASEMLISYARAICISPRDLWALFDIRNPIIVSRMERASSLSSLNNPPPPAPVPAATAGAATTARRGRVLPAWMTQPPSTREQLMEGGVTAVMSGYVNAAEWVRM